MKNLNKGLFTGRLGRPCQLRHTPTGTPVMENALAVTTGFGDSEGTAWIPLTFWGKNAENAAEYLGKGREIHVSGRWEQDNWEDKDTGKKRHLLRLNVEDWGFCGPKPEGVGSSQSQPAAPEPTTTRNVHDQQAAAAVAEGDDDIPF